MSGPVTRSQAKLATDFAQNAASLAVATMQGRNWKVVDSDNKKIPFDVFQTAVVDQAAKEKGITLSDKDKTFLGTIFTKMETLTAREAVKLFTNQSLKSKDSAYDLKLLKPGFDEAKTYQFAANYFGLGCDPEKRNEWIATFADKSVYTICNREYATGGKGIRKHLEEKFKQLDAITGEKTPLTFEMVTINVVHNMAISVLINRLPNGRGFPLVSLDFFDDNGKVLFNGDFYSFWDAAIEVPRFRAGKIWSRATSCFK